MDSLDKHDSFTKLVEELKAFLFVHRLLAFSYLPVIMLVINLLIWLLVVLFSPKSVSGDIHPAALLLAGAKSQTLILEGEWWRLCASIFLHLNFYHLMVNCIGIFFVSLLANNIFGWAKTVVLYVVGGVTGMIFSTLFEDSPSVGGSGAIFSMMSAIFVFGVQNYKRIPSKSRVSISLGIGTWVFLSFVLSFIAQGSDIYAHLGGVIAGCLLGVDHRSVILEPFVKQNPVVKFVFWICILLCIFSIIRGGLSLAQVTNISRPTLGFFVLDGLSLPYPRKWHVGKMGDKCTKIDKSDDLTPRLLSQDACFVDPFGATLTYSRTRALSEKLLLDSYLTVEQGNRTPLKRVDGDVVKEVILINREWALTFYYWKIMEKQYIPILNDLISAIKVN